MKNYLKIVHIDEYSSTPKYRQLVNAIMQGIESGQIVKDDQLPSINDFCVALDLSRNSVEKTYNTLKKAGIVTSVAGKGFFIAQDQFEQPVKTLLLFNKLSGHKKIVYDAFVDALGNSAAVDFYVYNNDFNIFKKLISEKVNSYAKFVIVPHFLENSDRAYEMINTIPREKLILLDKLVKGVTGNFSSIYQDFENDIYSALEQLLEQLCKYHTLKIIFPQDSYHSKEILKGFKRFCRQYAFDYDMITYVKDEVINQGTGYITLTEDDLVELIEMMINSGLTAGVDVGLISYNETPIKRVILNGITTISTNFEMMGKMAAEEVLNPSCQHIAVPFKVTLRKSL
ncbi:GntR family transcriptional regulator [Pedobacter sp. MC2016-14]|uniref:GntR family transcriptional regulator n=1 Tax=Pedobacter sp. MC2016-14 TaxID=2897327 RepID=UPI001E2F7B17|nr:GntR family transcriptional regulator [Pedobacter sp. MC2016-14]MCD0489024.1 GntR family transcriptional regulator [Pedobacter sp. MC2016-14]